MKTTATTKATRAAAKLVQEHGVEGALMALSAAIRALGPDCVEAADGVECVTGYCPLLTVDEVRARLTKVA